MQNLKKWGALFLCLVLAAGVFAGCSGSDVSQASSAVSSQASQDSSAVSSEADSSAASSEMSASDYDYSEGLTEDGCFEGVTALDYVSLPDYRSIEVPAEEAAVTDEEVQEQIDEFTSAYTTTEQVTDRAVEDGDTVNIDYVGSVDGVEFDGGNTNGAGTSVTIGVTNYIDDFLQQLIGHKPGETFDVNVTFPEPYENNPDLSGKDAVFVTTINYVEESIAPELTDEFVAEHWESTEGWSTVAEMKAGVRESLEVQKTGEYVWDQILEQAEVREIPQAIQNYHLENMKNYYTVMAQQYGMELEDFLTQAIGVEDMDSLVEENREMIDENARNSLILQALAEDMDFQVTQDVLDDYMKTALEMEDYADIADYYGNAYLCLLARESLVKDKLGRL